jgi:hypothetical protein
MPVAADALDDQVAGRLEQHPVNDGCLGLARRGGGRDPCHADVRFPAVRSFRAFPCSPDADDSGTMPVNTKRFLRVFRRRVNGGMSDDSAAVLDGSNGGDARAFLT